MTRYVAGEGVPALQHAAEVLGIHRSGEPELGGEGTDPTASRLTATAVVVLGRGRDLTDVVLGRARAQLPDVQHVVLPGRIAVLEKEKRGERPGRDMGSKLGRFRLAEPASL